MEPWYPCLGPEAAPRPGWQSKEVRGVSMELCKTTCLLPEEVDLRSQEHRQNWYLPKRPPGQDRLTFLLLLPLVPSALS